MVNLPAEVRRPGHDQARRQGQNEGGHRQPARRAPLSRRDGEAERRQSAERQGRHESEERRVLVLLDHRLGDAGVAHHDVPGRVAGEVDRQGEQRDQHEGPERGIGELTAPAQRAEQEQEEPEGDPEDGDVVEEQMQVGPVHGAPVAPPRGADRAARGAPCAPRPQGSRRWYQTVSRREPGPHRRRHPRCRTSPRWRAGIGAGRSGRRSRRSRGRDRGRCSARRGRSRATRRARGRGSAG